ncbi:tetratricopeptide repeat protein [Brevundimonas sp.]|uniref:tetratricopeptide repeat protein n=1 Tax=Brevundimonas sp. TaxID=1871086 RepID=UPI003F72DDE3
MNLELRGAARQIAAGEQDQGLARLQALADGGDLEAHNLLGEVYTGLDGVVRDRARSCEHFRVAREARPSAAHNYGQCLWEGAFGERELEQARVWYGRGADGGFLQAKCALGNMLIKGEGGAAEPERGVALCRQAADAGDPNAQADMGDHYGGGRGVAQDYAMARQWYERAAAQRQRNAAFQRGVLDWNGLGGPIDLVSASRWLEQAYEAGRKDAAILVGRSAFVRAVPNAPRGPVDVVLLAQAKRWYEIVVVEDPDPEARSRAAVMLAQISGYEALAREQTGGE